MKRTEETYGQLDKVLLALGFSCRPTKQAPPGRIYEHKEAGAVILLQAYPKSDKVYEHHLATVRPELDNFGLAEPGSSLPNSRRRVDLGFGGALEFHNTISPCS